MAWRCAPRASAEEGTGTRPSEPERWWSRSRLPPNTVPRKHVRFGSCSGRTTARRGRRCSSDSFGRGRRPCTTTCMTRSSGLRAVRGGSISPTEARSSEPDRPSGCGRGSCTSSRTRGPAFSSCSASSRLPGLPRLRILRPTSLDATAPPTRAPLRRRLTLLPVGGAGRRRARPKRPPCLPADAARECSAAARAIGRGRALRDLASRASGRPRRRPGDGSTGAHDVVEIWRLRRSVAPTRAGRPARRRLPPRGATPVVPRAACGRSPRPATISVDRRDRSTGSFQRVSATGTRTLPWSWYVDPTVLQLEQERIFRRFWQYVGRTDEITEPSSFHTTRAGHVPVLLVRDGEGTLRAFLNVCRHRGSIVCKGSGKRETLQCPYHAWTYGLDGRLLAARRADREGGIEEGLGLVPLQLETWGPFVFVNPDLDAPPLSDFLEDVPERVAEAGIDV